MFGLSKRPKTAVETGMTIWQAAPTDLRINSFRVWLGVGAGVPALSGPFTLVCPVEAIYIPPAKHNYYGSLSVPRTAPLAKIKPSHHRLRHPDRLTRLARVTRLERVSGSDGSRRDYSPPCSPTDHDSEPPSRSRIVARSTVSYPLAPGLRASRTYELGTKPAPPRTITRTPMGHNLQRSSDMFTMTGRLYSQDRFYPRLIVQPLLRQTFIIYPVDFSTLSYTDWNSPDGSG